MLNKIKLPNWFIIVSLLSSLAFILFLGYADEGYYDWRWLQDAGSWITLFIFWNVFFWTLIGIGIGLKHIYRKSSLLKNF